MTAEAAAQHRATIAWENSRFQDFAIRAWPLVDLGWLAGILDGEGSFKIVRRRGGTFNVAITVGSIDFPMVERCRTITGVGRLTEAWKQGRKRKLHIWEACGYDAIAVALLVEPHLVVKARQAQLVVGPLNEQAWLELRALHGRGELYDVGGGDAR